MNVKIKIKILVLFSLILSLFVLSGSALDKDVNPIEPTPVIFNDIKDLSVNDQFNKSICNGIGFTTDKDVQFTYNNELLQVTSVSKKPSVVFIPADINYKYIISHHELNITTSEYTVDRQFIPELTSINGTPYITFIAEDWSYYTVDGSLIQVGIPDIRLVGNTVEITGDGYSRLATPGTIYGWNQSILLKDHFGRIYPLGSNDDATDGRMGKVGCITPHTGTAVHLHSGTTYASSSTTVLNAYLDSTDFTLTAASNYYQQLFYLDSDHTSSQDVVIESFTPDHIDHFKLEMYNGSTSTWQVVWNDDTYTAANLVHLNNSSSGLDFGIYRSGQRGDTVSVMGGNMSMSDVTLSAYYGCINRTAFKVTMNADDGSDSASTGASQVKVRLTCYYNPEGVVDNSDYTNHGEQSGGVTRERDGVIGEACDFDGSSGYLDCGNDESLKPTGDITIEGWLYLSNVVGDKIIIGDAQYNAQGYDLYISGNKLNYRTCQAGTTQITTTSASIPVNSWKYIILTKTGSTARIYIDGVETSYSAQPAHTNPVVSSLNSYIGRYGAGVDSLFNGSIDEVRIYNRALNATEISEHYNHTFTNESGLVFHSPMELTPSGAATYEFENSANQYYGLGNLLTLQHVSDESDYDNVGIAHGGVTANASGHIGEACDFDGTSGHLEVSTYSTSNNMTVSAFCWVKPTSFSDFKGVIGHLGPPLSYNGYSLYIHGDGTIGTYLGAHRRSTETIPLNMWSLIGFVFNGSDLRIYINGTQVGYDTSVGYSGHSLLRIGNFYTNSTDAGRIFNGTIDEVRIYNRALNATEIAEHYNGTFNNETGLVFHSPMELSDPDTTLMLYKAGTSNVTYITNESGNAITGMKVRANEEEQIDRLYITYATEPTNISMIINQSAVDVDTDTDSDDVPDAFEDNVISVNKDAQGGECKWDYLWFGAYNHVNNTSYTYYSNLTNGSGLVGTPLQVASTTDVVNITMNSAGVNEEYNFSISSGISDWVNVTSDLTTGVQYRLHNGSDVIETQTADAFGSVNFTSDLTSETYVIDLLLNSVTGLVNSTTFTSHNWTWVNPTNAGFNHTMIYINSSWVTNTSNEYFNLITTPSNTSIIGIRTVDTAGFINTTWVNNTSITPPSIEITLLSFEPEIIYTNYTGKYNVSYGIIHESVGINNSSLAFLFGLNYTVDSSYSNSIRPPSNDISASIAAYSDQGNIFRQFQRNITPYLGFETNDTMTEGNIWKWGGLDYNSPSLVVNSVNSTYTYVNVTGSHITAHQNMHYLDAMYMFASAKTQLPISKSQGLLVKIWDIDQIHNRNNNYFLTLYIGSNDSGVVPDTDIKVRLLNSSFNPLTDDPVTSNYSTEIGTYTPTEWLNYSFEPHPNASYVHPIVVNVSALPMELDENNYIYFHSDTVTPKPYHINVTDGASGTNRTFGETGVAWTRALPAGTVSAYAYTPNIFVTYTRDFEQIEVQLYGANNNSIWAQSGISNFSIGASHFIPTTPSFSHFTFAGHNDTTMDCTYRDNITVWVTPGIDPDGGPVTNNLTLWRADQTTFVATINNTFVCINGSVGVNFNTTPYYSTTTLYNIKCETEDDEGTSSSRWLYRNFSLSPLGTSGAFVDNCRITFWGMDDVADLYTTIADPTALSLSGGVYTFHTSIHHSQYGDVWNVTSYNKIVSINEPCTPYYRITGTDNIDGGKIVSWNETTGTYATCDDTYRAYMYSDENYSSVTIKNSNLSYLGRGISPYRGVFIQNGEGIEIDNSTFSHNDYGLYIVDGGNFSITNNTFIHPENVCLFLKTTDDNVSIQNNKFYSDAVNSSAIQTYHVGSDYEFINNTISGTLQSGLLLKDIEDSIISYNTMSGLQYGVQLSRNSKNITVINNNISAEKDYLGSYGWGITAMSTLGEHNISNNIIVVDDGGGLAISGTNNTILVNNSIVIGDNSYGDYYFKETMIGNVIQNLADVSNSIEIYDVNVSVLIENTNGQIFSENSTNISYAYVNNTFSLNINNVVEYITITQYNNMTVLPSTDKLAVWGLEWGAQVKFNASSDTGVNPTWFNLTNTSYISETVDIYRNNTLYANEIPDVSGLITYNYSDSYSEKWFMFQIKPETTDPSNLINETYNFGVRYDWDTTSDIDSFNVSINGSWTYGSTNTYSNNSTIPHGHIEIIVYGYNNTIGLSLGYLTDNITMDNNPITLTNTSDFNVYEGNNIFIDYDSNDLDSDTPIYTCNRTDLFTDFNIASGEGNWTPTYTQAGTYYIDMGVYDGYGSTDNYTMTIVVSDEVLTFTSYWNSVTGNNFNLNINTSTGTVYVDFGVVLNHSAVNISWYNNSNFIGNNSSTNTGNLTWSWDTNHESGTHYINVSALNEESSAGTLSFMINISTFSRISGHVYYFLEDPPTLLYLPDTTVTANGVTIIAGDDDGFYDFGYIFVQNSTNTILVERYGFVDNTTVLTNVTGDYVHDVSMVLNPMESLVPITPASGTRLPLGGVIPIISMLVAIMYFRMHNKNSK